MAVVLGWLAAIVVCFVPMEIRADPCRPAEPGALVSFDTIIGPMKVDSAFLGDPFFGVGSPSMNPTFSLWYPEGTPVDLETRGLKTQGPCEEGKKGIISFRLDEAVGHSKPFGAFATIARVRANFHETGADFFQGLASADHNLDGPVSGERNYHILDDLGERIAVLSCTAWRGAEAPLRPSCHGLIGFFDRGLVVHAQFPAQMGIDGTTARWRDIADFIDAQIAKWTN